ncbi:hypothetical protein NP493_1446g00009 [Ridgeia piscesae]|uniref:Phosphoinositide phospholipase C n=1 Tax=Ridgeia piscesae TaxID=27915 RepID=A0AAD9NE48_RIDPI|nr:hypothetical protein NP493_1446g00009 [Ridgeia piscesae]
MRTYPGALKVDSSNPNPLTFWPCGIQLVALNYQKDDPNMHINTAMFEQNARCGYVLKPPVFWDKTHTLFNPFGRDFEGIKPTTLTIHLISGQYVFPHHDGSPQVEVEIIGIPVDLSRIRSLPVSRNSANPIWNEAYTFQIHFPQLAFVRFGVMDTKGNENVAAQRVIPLKCLRPGYRHVRLRSSSSQPLDMATLFIYSSTTKQKAPVDVPKRSFLISVSGAMTDAMQLTVTENTIVQDAIKLLLVKLGKTERQLGDYELLEVAHKAGDSGVTTRVLGMNDRILQGQNKGRRRDKFVLRQREVRRAVPSGPSHFRVQIYGMSETHDYSILELPVTATVEDVIVRALAKAQRTDAPQDMLLQMEPRKKTKRDVLDKHVLMHDVWKKNSGATYHLTKRVCNGRLKQCNSIRRKPSKDDNRPSHERPSRRNTIDALVNATAESTPVLLSPPPTPRFRSKSPAASFKNLFSKMKK